MCKNICNWYSVGSVKLMINGFYLSAGFGQVRQNLMGFGDGL